MDKPEWIISMLAANNNEPIKGITRFEKLIYYSLAKYYNNDLQDFGYEAYDFGPHSDDIRDLLYALQDVGLIEISKKTPKNFLEVDDIDYEDDDELLPINYDKMEIYTLTEKGLNVAKKIDQIHGLSNKLDKIKKKFNNISLKELIRIVYIEFPNMTTKSLIRDEILN